MQMLRIILVASLVAQLARPPGYVVIPGVCDGGSVAVVRVVPAGTDLAPAGCDEAATARRAMRNAPPAIGFGFERVLRSALQAIRSETCGGPVRVVLRSNCDARLPEPSPCATSDCTTCADQPCGTTASGGCEVPPAGCVDAGRAEGPSDPCGSALDDSIPTCRIRLNPYECCERVPVPPRKPAESPPRSFLLSSPMQPAIIVGAASVRTQVVRPVGVRDTRPVNPTFGDALRAIFCIWLN